MYFAVKTCAMYHKERLAVIRKTWGKYAKNIGFFTDELGKHSLHLSFQKNNNDK